MSETANDDILENTALCTWLSNADILTEKNWLSIH